jgi:DedD protein
MSDLPDANLQLKKRARRRLVGAVAFAGLAAVVLPMVMDEEPKQQLQDVQILIPGQDQTPFSPTLELSTTLSMKGLSQDQVSSAPTPAPAGGETKEAPSAEAVGSDATPVARPVEKPAARPVEKPVEKPAAKPAEKPAEKPLEKTVEKQTEAQRAAAILSGKTTDDPAPANDKDSFVIVVGTFSNTANVKELQTKIKGLGIKVYTESLESPEGRKTRVRAGPFASRNAAEKALEKMKRIGINNGMIVAKQ